MDDNKEEQQWFMSDQEYKSKLSGYLNKVKNRKNVAFSVKDNFSLALFLVIVGTLLTLLISISVLILIPSLLLVVIMLSPIIVLETMIREILKIKKRGKINEDNSERID